MIRQADWEDVPRLISYISAFHQASPWAREEFSPGATRIELQDMIASPASCIFLHDHGVIGGQLVPLRFGKSLIAQELFWWAERDGFSLLKKFESWAIDNNADIICMAALTGTRLGRIYERRGYLPKESFFVRHL